MRASVLILFLCLIVSLNSIGLAQNLFSNPESVVYDGVYDRYLVANTGNGNIIQLTDAGDTSIYASPSMSCRGLLIIGGALFGVGDEGLFMLSLSSGLTAWTLYIPGMRYLNDLTTDGNGYLYITDWEGDKIYKVRISDQSYSTFVSSGLNFPNGIVYDEENDRLILCSSAANMPLQGVTLSDSSLYTIVDPGFDGQDGIAVDDEGNYYVSAWPTNSVYRFEPTFTDPPVVVSSGHDGPADIYLNTENDILAVPNFNSNTVDLVQLTVGQFTRMYDPVLTGGSGNSWGCAWIDYDNDSYLDLSLHQLDNSCQLFHNDAGTGFTEITDNDLVNFYDGGQGTNGTWADYDNDGDIDVFISTFQEPGGAYNYLFENNGGGSFSRATEGIHVNEASMSISPSWVDFDNDGLLDLSVANHNGGNFLYHQDDTGFVRITTGGIVTDYGESNCTSWCDFNDNGYPDVHYANFFGTQINQCYLNSGDDSFISATGHVVTDAHHSMGSCWGDYDNDGDFDLFVTSGIDINQDILYENIGGGTLLEVDDSLFNYTLRSSHGASWADYDNDGDIDLYVAGQEPDYHSLLYTNNGDGSFELITVNEVVTDTDENMGVGWGDYDKDGDLDLYTSYYGAGNGALYRNNGNENNWLSITCIGTNSNRSAIGAKVRTLATINGEPVWQLRQISAQTSYCGQNSLKVHFGLGDATTVDSLIIEWPSGVDDTYAGEPANQFISYTETVCGDANGDGMVNIGDAVFLITYIFKGGEAPGSLFAGDANGEGAINIGDAVYLISFIFNAGDAPKCSS